MNYDTLRNANAARQALWNNPGKPLDLTYRVNELTGEVGEATEVALMLKVAKLANTAKKVERQRRDMPGSRVTQEQLADELADVMICCDLVALGEGIDLDAAVVRKFNETSRKVGFDVFLVGFDVFLGLTG